MSHEIFFGRQRDIVDMLRDAFEHRIGEARRAGMAAFFRKIHAGVDHRREGDLVTEDRLKNAHAQDEMDGTRQLGDAELHG